MRLTIGQYNDLVHSVLTPRAAAPAPAQAASAAPSPRDRRVDPRQPVSGNLFILVEKSDGSLAAPSRARVEDASPGGVGLLYTQSLEIGSHFVIHFPRLADQPLSIRCAVRNCSPSPSGHFRIGAEFESTFK